jgi:hypothetical protein
MRVVVSVLFSLVVGFALVASLQAQDKEVTLKGSITCAKCDLKETKACATVIKVKEKDKDVVYYFDTDSHKKNHGTICKAAMDGTVTGKVSEKDGKHIITVTKVDIK